MTRLWDITVYMYFYKHYCMIHMGNYPQTRKNWLPSMVWIRSCAAPKFPCHFAFVPSSRQWCFVEDLGPRGQKVGKAILLDTSCVHGMHPKTRRFLHHDHKMVPGSLSCWILRESARHIQRFLEMSGEDWMILNVWCSIAHRIHVWYIW